ncbi:hypothetical protein [Jeotgalibacillus salarius]|uniref:Uncharacterized protein n=1 Tax=Jeotgalibacillus salarius TaxID=546023 RepID=A0A4Y8LJ20_9BACL|nr:hypothetical protein [Jeotgalibacillus salarius]TFE02391.1 hypothetical protein E2626_07365 [Jeotgalibacillus salarius]
MFIKPTEKQLNQWCEIYIPDQDFFFVKESALEIIEHYITGEKLYTRKSFFSEPNYTNQNLNNSYMYWALSEEMTHVLVASHDWITGLPEEVRVYLLELQTTLRKGLIFPKEILPTSITIPDEYVHHVQGSDYVVIQGALWQSFSIEDKRSIMSAYAQLWDQWHSLPLPDTAPVNLKKYANTFSSSHGANCLAATTYGITSDENLVHCWMTEDEFSAVLKRAAYESSDSIQEPGDVLVFEDKQGVIQHAAFHIGDSLYFNKNGQMFFNPWKVVHWEDLLSEWGHLNQISYRKGMSKEKVRP